MHNLKKWMGPSLALLLAACGSTPAPDLTAPEIKITASSTKITSKQTLKITANATDEGGKVSKVEFFKDGQLVFTDTQAPYEYTEAFNTDGVVSSSTYAAKAHDTNKNVGISNAVKVDVSIRDNTTPTVELNANNTIFVNKGTLKLTATAQDNVGVSKVEFYKDDQKVAEDTSAPYEYTETFDIEGQSGNFKYHARVVDTTSNSSNSQPVQVLINIPDETPPGQVKLTANATAFITKGTLKLTATAQDNLMLARVEFYKDSKKVSEDTTAPYEYTETFDQDPLQSNSSYSVKAFDGHNNATTSQPLSVVVNIPDQTPPTLDLASNQTEFNNKGTLKLTATAQDNVGISKVEFYKDDQKVAEDISAPYEYTETFDIEGQSGNFKYHARALDAQGLSATVPALLVKVNIPDQTPPTINISANQTAFDAAGSLVITADAQDNVGVSKVEFYKDGVLVKTDTTLPYTLEEWIANEGTFKYSAKVFDLSNQLASSNEVQVTSTVKVTTLTGLYNQQIQEWPTSAGITGTVVGQTSYQNQKPQFLTSGDVSADGVFSLELPTPDASTLGIIGSPTNLPPECTSSLNVSDPNTLVANLLTNVETGTATPNVPIWASTTKQPNDGGTGYVPFYADKDLDLTGTIQCQNLTNYPYESETYDVHLKKGWNLLAINYTNPKNVQFSSTTTVPADLKWWLGMPINPLPTSNIANLKNQQIVGWNASLGSHVDFKFTGSLIGSNGNGTSLLQTPVNEQGQFNALLPNPPAELMQPLALWGTGCTGELVLSDPSALGGGMNTNLMTPGSGILTSLAAANTNPFTGMPAVGDTQYFPTFTDRNVLLTGDLFCGGTFVHYNMFLTKGWNLMSATVMSTSPFEISLGGMQDVPQDMSWWPYVFNQPLNKPSTFAALQQSASSITEKTPHFLFGPKLPF